MHMVRIHIDQPIKPQEEDDEAACIQSQESQVSMKPNSKVKQLILKSKEEAKTKQTAKLNARPVMKTMKYDVKKIKDSLDEKKLKQEKLMDIRKKGAKKREEKQQRKTAKILQEEYLNKK